MFQKISGVEKKEREEVRLNFNDYKNIIRKIFTPQNNILYIIALAISTVPFLDDMNPFRNGIFSSSICQ